ncbi:hypothetical protein B0H10DRAFT_2276468 [Mycena sp. CBHHK59/15]|nr:hypothetical protein B0H10DRAFT_2276468 [Mycena sp. CBHHK59/15]
MRLRRRGDQTLSPAQHRAIARARLRIAMRTPPPRNSRCGKVPHTQNCTSPLSSMRLRRRGDQTLSPAQQRVIARARLRITMLAPPPRNSRPGKVYAFTIGDLGADPPNRRTRRAWERDMAKIVKVGRTNNIVRRAREWRKQCPGQVQIWQWYYETRYAAKLGLCGRVMYMDD